MGRSLCLTVTASAHVNRKQEPQTCYRDGAHTANQTNPNWLVGFERIECSTGAPVMHEHSNRIKRSDHHPLDLAPTSNNGMNETQDEALLLLLRLPSLAFACTSAQSAHNDSLPRASAQYESSSKYLRSLAPLILEETAEAARGELESNCSSKYGSGKGAFSSESLPAEPWPLLGLPVVFHPDTTRVVERRQRVSFAQSVRGCIASGNIRAPAPIVLRKPQQSRHTHQSSA